MPRDGKNKNASEKSQAERYAGELAKKVLDKLCKEKVFPKRSRWIIAKKIADLTVDFHSSVHKANGIKVVTQGERDERHKAQTLALANLSALDAELNLAMDVLNINPDDLGDIAELEKTCERVIQGWINAEIKRDGPPTRIKLLEAEAIEGDSR